MKSQIQDREAGRVPVPPEKRFLIRKAKVVVRKQPSKSVLGLDWDGTISAYPDALRLIAQRFDLCVVITLNDDITTGDARKILAMPHVVVEACPYSRTDFSAWKIERCRANKVNLMVEDDPTFAAACEQAGIPVLLVAFPEWRETD
jgi:uncharacterized HAD superfamily protein